MAEYRLIIENGGSVGDNGFAAPSDSSPSSSGSSNAKNPAKEVVRSFAKVWGGASLARSVFSYAASRVGVYTGNQDLQDKIDFGMEVGGQLLGTVLGFGLGGVSGGLAVLGGVALSYAKKNEQYSYNRTWESIALEQARFRAGPSFNRSRR